MIIKLWTSAGYPIVYHDCELVTSVAGLINFTGKDETDNRIHVKSNLGYVISQDPTKSSQSCVK